MQVEQSSTLPVEIKLAEDGLAREHALESKMLQLQQDRDRLQAMLDRVPETHTPRKLQKPKGPDNSGQAEVEMERLRQQITQRELELDETYRKLVAVCKVKT